MGQGSEQGTNEAGGAGAPLPAGRAKKRARLGVSLATRIATEHLSYRSLIEEIESDLEPARTSGDAGRLLRLLRSFQAQVRGHFALEERGGLFDVYREHDQALRDQAQVLAAQHRDFLERLRRVLDVAALTRFDSPGFDQAAGELRDLFRDLRQHELAEDALLERLVEQDIRREV